MIQPLYFAFGSNLLKARINARIGHLGPIEKAGNFILQGYELLFNCSPNRRFPYANISEKLGSCVHGVLYKINEHQIHELDRYEGYPLMYEKFYLIDNGRIIFGYHSVNPMAYVKKGQPFHEYLDIII